MFGIKLDEVISKMILKKIITRYVKEHLGEDAEVTLYNLVIQSVGNYTKIDINGSITINDETLKKLI